MNYYHIERDGNFLELYMTNVTVSSSVSELKAFNPRGSGYAFLEVIPARRQGAVPDDRIILNQAVVLNFYSDSPNDANLSMPTIGVEVELPITLQFTNFIRDLASIIDE